LSKHSKNEKVLEELLEKLGAERFGELFDVKTTIKPNKAFHTDRYTKPELGKKVALVVENTGHLNPTHVLKVK
jgi:hypothetical protein